MHDEVQRSFSNGHGWGAYAVDQVLKPRSPGASFVCCESDGGPLSSVLDHHAGCDWLMERDGRVYGWAVRVQKACFAPYETITIRHKRRQNGVEQESEFQKGLTAIKRGSVWPAYRLMAYVEVENGEPTDVVCWAVAKERELLEWVYENRDWMPQNGTADEARGQEQLFYCPRFSMIPDNILLLSQRYDG